MADLEDLPESLTNRVAFLLRLALVRAETMGERALGELELSGREYGILALLEPGPPRAQHQLGAVLGIDRTTMVGLLAGLQARALITRDPDPANRRAHRVLLTPAGDSLRERAAQALRECDERFLSALPAAQRHQLTDSLRGLSGRGRD